MDKRLYKAGEEIEKEPVNCTCKPEERPVCKVCGGSGYSYPCKHFKSSETVKHVDIKNAVEKSDQQEKARLRKDILSKGGVYRKEWGITRLQQEIFNLSHG